MKSLKARTFKLSNVVCVQTQDKRARNCYWCFQSLYKPSLCLLVKLIQSLYFEILSSYWRINKYERFIEDKTGYMHNGIQPNKGRSDISIQTFDLVLSFKVGYCYSVVPAGSSQALETLSPLCSSLEWTTSTFHCFWKHLILFVRFIFHS